ncbi:MAG TPA: WS/DGAT domain-containing protein [Acidimicrobiales bacterium]
MDLAAAEYDPIGLAPTLLSLGGRLISEFGLFNRVPPIANLVMFSVPGPPIHLRPSGRRLAWAASVGPLFGIFSLNITVLGFERHLKFGLLGSADRMPDPAALREYLLDEVTALIGATPA